MNISVPDDRWVIFSAEPKDCYKGFKLLEPIRTKPGKAQLSFSNDDDESFTVYESSIEDAFIKAFDIIDTISD